MKTHSEWRPLTRKLVIKQPLTQAETEAAKLLVADDNIKAETAKAAKQAASSNAPFITPAEQGESIFVPQLSLLVIANGKEELTPFIDTAGQLLVKPDLTAKDAEPEEADTSLINADNDSSGLIDIDANGRMERHFIASAQFALNLVYAPENWDEIKLAAWLCRQISAPWLDDKTKYAFVLAWLQNLMLRHGVPLTRAVRKKSVIRSILEERLAEINRKAIHAAGQQALFSDEAANRFRVSREAGFTLRPDGYFPTSVYEPARSKWGSHHFKKHFYPVIGDFDSREEFECAVVLDNEAIKGGIKHWVRNLAKGPTAFYLKKIEGRYYPDFICVLPDDKILIVEYKGANMWDTPKVQEDRAIGNLWAELSGGECRYLMIKNRDWASLERKIWGN